MPTKRTKKIMKSETKIASQEELQADASLQPQVSSKKTFWENMRRPQVFIPIIIIILGILFYFLRSWLIVATVNGEPISRMQFEHQLEVKDGKQTLSSMVNQTLILQEAKKRNIVVTQAEVDASINQIEKSLKAQGQTLDQALATQGMSKQDLETQIIIQKLVQKMLAKNIQVSDKEIEDYISANKDNIPTTLKPEEIKAQVKQQLQQQKTNDQAQILLANLQKSAKIDYLIKL